jgi:hypothetical protein
VFLLSIFLTIIPYASFSATGPAKDEIEKFADQIDPWLDNRFKEYKKCCNSNKVEYKKCEKSYLEDLKKMVDKVNKRIYNHVNPMTKKDIEEFNANYLKLTDSVAATPYGMNSNDVGSIRTLEFGLRISLIKMQIRLMRDILLLITYKP